MIILKQVVAEKCLTEKNVHMYYIRVREGKIERGMCIKGLSCPPLEPKTENCFSQISFDWFIRRMTEV